jgi:hypothetical protein
MSDPLPPADGMDPYRVAVVRAELDEAGDRRAARAAARAGDGMSNIEAARAIARVLELSMQELGITEVSDLDDALRQILSRARTGGLSPGSYRVAYALAQIPRSDAPRTAAIPAVSPP